MTQIKQITTDKNGTLMTQIKQINTNKNIKSVKISENLEHLCYLCSPKNMIIKGNSFTDPRGTLHFVNDFHFEGIKRFYTITHPDISVIRAWQGHKIECKHFFVSKGKFLICWVKIDNWDNPAKDLKVNRQILSVDEPQILIIPPGNANGFKALEDDSTLVVFSDLTLEESSGDMYRFESDYWDIWNTDDTDSTDTHE